MEKRIKRLESAIVGLFILFLLSIFVSIYTITQIKLIGDKIPNYKEIKEDIKTLEKVYVKTSNVTDSLHIKEKVIETYDKITNMIDVVRKDETNKK